MPALHIRNIDDAVIAGLEARAARNHRSLEGKVRSVLEAAAGRGGTRGRTTRTPLRWRKVRVGAQVSFSRDVIYDAADR